MRTPHSESFREAIAPVLPRAAPLCPSSIWPGSWGCVRRTPTRRLALERSDRGVGRAVSAPKTHQTSAVSSLPAFSLEPAPSSTPLPVASASELGSPPSLAPVLRTSPKNRGPDQCAPVISKAIAVSEGKVLPSYSKPSSRTHTECVLPCHSRTRRAPDFNLGVGSGAIRPSLSNSPASLARRRSIDCGRPRKRFPGCGRRRCASSGRGSSEAARGGKADATLGEGQANPVSPTRQAAPQRWIGQAHTSSAGRRPRLTLHDAVRRGGHRPRGSQSLGRLRLVITVAASGGWMASTRRFVSSLG